MSESWHQTHFHISINDLQKLMIETTEPKPENLKIRLLNHPAGDFLQIVDESGYIRYVARIKDDWIDPNTREVLPAFFITLNGDVLVIHKSQVEKVGPERLAPQFSIWHCSDRTEGTCLAKNLFGMKESLNWAYQHVLPGQYALLLNVQSNYVRGPFKISCSPTLNLDPVAFNSCFPLQIKVKPTNEDRSMYHTGILLDHLGIDTWTFPLGNRTTDVKFLNPIDSWKFALFYGLLGTKNS